MADTPTHAASPDVIEDERTILDDMDNEDEIEEDLTDPAPLKSITELERELGLIRSQNSLASRELQMYEAYLVRFRKENPEDAEAMAKKKLATEGSESPRSTRKSSRMSKRSQKTRSGNKLQTRRNPVFQTLALQEKGTIANKEFELTTARTNQSLQADKDHFDAVTAEEEAHEINLEEYKKGAADKQKLYVEVAMAAKNGTDEPLTDNRLRKMHTETVKRYNNMIKKQQLKASATRSHLRQVEIMIKNKDGQGADVTVVDFDVLKIEGKKCSETLQKRNVEMLDLKHQVGVMARVCDKHQAVIRKALGVNNTIGAAADKSIGMQAKTDREAVIVAEELKVLQKANAKLQTRIDRHRAPPVLAYVRQKQEREEVMHDTKTWERRVKQAASQHRQLRSQWKSVAVATQMMAANENDPWSVSQPGPASRTGSATRRRGSNVQKGLDWELRNNGARPPNGIEARGIPSM